MSPPARLLAPLEVAPSRISNALYVCSTCRRQCLPQHLRSINHQFQFRWYTPTNTNLNNNSNDLPVTEKLRRKIWGTDKPPGVKDPYGSESQLDHAEPLAEIDEPHALEESEMGEEGQGIRVATAEEKEDAEYKHADTWEGLRQVGAEQWWESPPRAEDQFEPFMTLEKATSRVTFYQILHHTLVELLILKDMSKPFTDGCNIIGYEDDILSIINQVEVEPSSDFSMATLAFPSEEAKATIFEWFSQLYQPIEGVTETGGVDIAFDAESAQTEELTAEEEALLAEAERDDIDIKGPTPYRPKNLDFLGISLADPEFKFAYLKRVSQLTGYRIPDPEVAKMTKPSRVVNFLSEVSKPKPKKLAEQLLQDKRLISLPNVKIMDRRYTPIDKEKEIGRWKIIEEELTKRGLPVTGRARA
ncbi:hypothetical protein AJ78_06683 [Emergomyces pasteurianus Ep9510]|uniref:Large ribosomal subunit protein mL50 n=1 Tax=Emergomyces pasteurianus Ep9510 TaxID=1447872 RepID=A0A1J9P9L8_9EURO|nr:hypothetical protein AJ78_06683 [Emergomyces pasteurianus Ep9510]